MKRTIVAGALAVILVGCGGSTTPAAVTPSSTPVVSAPGPLATPDACRGTVTSLSAFTQRLATNLASLRPLVVATQFDVAATVQGIRRVSSTFTDYHALGKTMGDCRAAAQLAGQFEQLTKAADAALESSARDSMIDPRLQRDAAVSLFGLLPEVLSLSAAAQASASTLGLDVEQATVPEGTLAPVGSLPPLPTAPPLAVATTPRPTAPAKATPRPTTLPAGVKASWKTAMAYEKAVSVAYRGIAVSARPVSFQFCNDPNETGEWRAACFDELNAQIASRKAFDAHRAWMTAHPQSCLKDAYKADRALLAYLERVMDIGMLAADTNFDDIQHRINVFSGNQPKYISDCR